MKARFLKPGDKVIVASRFSFRPRTMTFVERIKRIGRSGISVFQCEDYVGLNGPNDKGLCEMTDHDVARNVQREVAA